MIRRMIRHLMCCLALLATTAEAAPGAISTAFRRAVHARRFPWIVGLSAFRIRSGGFTGKHRKVLSSNQSFEQHPQFKK